MIKSLSSIIVSLMIGILIGRFLLGSKSPTTIKTITQTQTTSTNKIDEKKQTQEQKISNINENSTYVEKSFNNKGILIHEVIVGNNKEASSIDSKQVMATIVVRQNKTSNTKSTTISSYNTSNLYGGIAINTKDITKPSNFQLQDINFMIEFRPFQRINFFASSNYKFNSIQIGILTALN